MSSVIAMKEGTTLVPNTPQHSVELRSELRELEKELSAIGTLQGYGLLSTVPSQAIPTGTGYTLIVLDRTDRSIRLKSFPRTQAMRAFMEYTEVEKRYEDKQSHDIVLVSAESLVQLKRAYPNYFLNTTEFVKLIEKAVK